MSKLGGAYCRLKITISYFNFKSARGANYRKYGNNERTEGWTDGQTYGRSGL